MPDLILQNVTIDDATIYGGVSGGVSVSFNSGVYRTASGYALNGRSGWTLNTVAPTSYDDGYALVSGIIPSGTSWFWNNIAYTSLYIGTNGYIPFGAGSSIINPGVNSSIQAIFLCPADNYWGTNGANGNGNTASGVAYKKGTTSTGLNFFSINMMGYKYLSTSTDRGWELNCFYDSNNSNQYIEIIWGPAHNNTDTFTFGLYYGTTTLAVPASGVLAANRSYCFSSSNKGVSWTAHGLGSWSGVGTF